MHKALSLKINFNWALTNQSASGSPVEIYMVQLGVLNELFGFSKQKLQTVNC